jgi:hypothetical protein
MNRGERGISQLKGGKRGWIEMQWRNEKPEERRLESLRSWSVISTSEVANQDPGEEALERRLSSLLPSEKTSP